MDNSRRSLIICQFILHVAQNMKLWCEKILTLLLVDPGAPAPLVDVRYDDVMAWCKQNCNNQLTCTKRGHLRGVALGHLSKLDVLNRCTPPLKHPNPQHDTSAILSLLTSMYSSSLLRITL